MFILDSHCDTPSQILRGRDLGKDNQRGHVDFPKIIKGGVDCTFFALYTPSIVPEAEATGFALKMLAGVYDEVALHKDSVAIAYNSAEVLANKAKGLASIMIGMENGSPIQDSLSLLRLFYKMGVRYVTLTHNGDNLIADAASNGTTWHGLSPFGKEVVAEMNRLGMIVDVAHVSDETFYDCIKYSKTPIVSTHSCCRALCSHKRNLTDDMLKALADNGGVMQVNFYPMFLDDDFAESFSSSELSEEASRVEKEFRKDPFDPKNIEAWNEMQDRLAAVETPSVLRVVDHIDHAVSVAGIDSVGIGSDFDGINVAPKGLENISKIGAVFEEMRKRGYSESDIEKVAGLNFMRVLKVNEDFASKS